jgi:ribose transport system substrate-binding protein
MRARQPVILVVTVIAVMILSACAPRAAPTATPTKAPVAEPTEAPPVEIAEEMTLEEVEAAYGPMDKASKPYFIGTVVKTLVNEHWQQVKKGYEAAASDLGVEVEVVAADSESNFEQQLNFAQTLIGKGIDALCVSPLSTTNLDAALEQASQDGVPIINVDDARVTNVPVVFMGGDHRQMGVLGAQYMIEHLPEGSKVAMVEGQAGSNAGEARKDGFHTTIQNSNLQLVSSQPGEWDRVTALNAATNILQAHPDIKGIYAANDTMALGVIEAMGGSSVDADIIVIGTDAVPEAIQAVREGRLHGTVAQFPYDYGYNGLVLAVRALEGQKLPAVIHAPMALVTPDNIAQYYP